MGTSPQHSGGSATLLRLSAASGHGPVQKGRVHHSPPPEPTAFLGAVGLSSLVPSGSPFPLSPHSSGASLQRLGSTSLGYEAPHNRLPCLATNSATRDPAPLWPGSALVALFPLPYAQSPCTPGTWGPPAPQGLAARGPYGKAAQNTQGATSGLIL